LAQAFLNPGDEVIIPAPYWVSYPDITLMAEAKPVILFAGVEQNFKITPQQLERAITPKTKLFVINSPSNPTGMAYTREELKALAAVLLKYPNILIATDDMYEHIYWGTEPFSNILMVCPELYDRTVILHGVSKTYAMTGWRIGYAAGPKWIIEWMGTIQSHSTSNPSSISQKAAVAAIAGDQSCIDTMLKAFKERHDFIVKALNEIPGFQCLENDGTFYAFVKITDAMENLKQKLDFEEFAKRLGEDNSENGTMTNDQLLAEYLLQKALVATVPGTAFGAPGYLRLSYATSLLNLTEAIKRIKDCLR
jgi:aspartate aminotransferase